MIEIKNIKKDYPAGDMLVKALKGVNINFRSNEFVSILGPSGCGKTTLLNIIGGLDQYTDGDIVIDGISTKDYKDRDWDTYRNHYIGFVFQSYNLIAHLSILENVELALSIAGISKKEKRKRALEALDRVGLSDQVKKRPNQLSGGQMQRVAIARAIVNDPKIILADEPTGALDSETSVQVMDILKEISKTCLVVMVTHNGDLADKYSDRIIKMLDGELTHDSNPYEPADVKPENKEQSEIQQADAPVKKKHSAMSFFTAFSLSFKNLISKKWKTILVSFAGSIGIIGIALILAVSNGLNTYIANMQSDTLSGYPVTIGTIAVNFDAFSKMGVQKEDKKEVDKNTELELYDYAKLFESAGNFNFLNGEFVNYITDYYNDDQEKPKDQQELIDLKLTYNTTMPVLTKMAFGSQEIVMSLNTSSSISALSGTGSSGVFVESLNNKEYVLENYDILGGETAYYPTNKNEVALVVSNNNSEAIQTLQSYGYSINPSSESIDFESLLGKEYKVVSSEKYYKYDSANDIFTKLDLRLYDENNDLILSQIPMLKSYYEFNDNETLKVTCVLRAKEGAISQVLSSGIMYLPELSEYLREQTKTSTIYQKTIALDVDDQLYFPYAPSIAELSSLPIDFSNTFTYATLQEVMNKINTEPYNLNLTKDDALQLALQMIGASSVPNSISIYTKSFDAKQNLVDHIAKWNKQSHTANNKITYSDATEFLTETLGTLIDIISYVLIAFSGVSLVVSSIMIGIITYTSVIERTKEIGVLRSIGARKKDITRVFNSETLIIGFVSGSIGVFISWILTFPISSIIKSVAGGSITTSMAILTIPNAITLIAISTILTIISGLIPAIIAAKKDPVKALRTE